MKIGIVVAEFNGDVTSRMLEVAHERTQKLNVEVDKVCIVPGTFDMPIIVDTLLSKPDIAGVATLGAVIKGQTKHDELIAHATAASIQALSLKHGKPVTLGITGPGMSAKQAFARSRTAAARAIDALVFLLQEIDRVK